MLTHRKSDNLEVVGYLDADYDGCVKTTFGYVFTLATGAIL
jgi:hypothetical protein